MPKKVSLEKPWHRVNLNLCGESRGILETWKENNISLPTALATCTRLAGSGDINCLDVPRADFERVGFQLTHATVKTLDGLAERWGCSRSDAADRIIIGTAEAILAGQRVDLELILPIDLIEIPMED